MACFQLNVASLVTIALLALVSAARGCSVPRGGCKNCDNLIMGVYLGVYKGPPGTTISQPGSGNINYERFKSVQGKATIVGKVNISLVATVSQCCKACAATTSCSFYHFYDSPEFPNPSKLPVKNVRCYLLNGGYPGTLNNDTSIPASYIGGRCNGAPGVTDDPHFIGAQGTPYDFNGQLDKSFCLISDTRLHVNALLSGYEAKGAATAGEHKIRSWIKELGILWRDETGTPHTLRIAARNGKEQDRGTSGFLRSILIDEVPFLAPSNIGDTVTAPGGITLVLTDLTNHGALDMDVFHLTIDNILEADISARVAHPLLQRPDDAEAHLNLKVHDMAAATAGIHGVLGQTYREEEPRKERAYSFRQLAMMLKKPVAADGESGKGFIDGSVEDYISSGVDRADCKYAMAWNGAALEH